MEICSMILVFLLGGTFFGLSFYLNYKKFNYNSKFQESELPSLRDYSKKVDFL